MMEKDSENIKIKLIIDNAPGNLSKIYLEPWADEINVHQGDEVVIVAAGPANTATIDQTYKGDVLIIYAAHGWTLTALLNGKEVITASRAIPSI